MFSSESIFFLFARVRISVWYGFGYIHMYITWHESNVENPTHQFYHYHLTEADYQGWSIYFPRGSPTHSSVTLMSGVQGDQGPLPTKLRADIRKQ